MQHLRLHKALTKAGATITNPHNDATDGSPRYFRAEKNGRLVCWYVQKKWNDPEVLEAVSVHSPSPHTDIMTDCFCDTYFSGIREAVASLDW